jgi:hypothetical protein
VSNEYGRKKLGREILSVVCSVMEGHLHKNGDLVMKILERYLRKLSEGHVMEVSVEATVSLRINLEQMRRKEQYQDCTLVFVEWEGRGSDGRGRRRPKEVSAAEGRGEGSFSKIQ